MKHPFLRRVVSQFPTRGFRHELLRASKTQEFPGKKTWCLTKKTGFIRAKPLFKQNPTRPVQNSYFTNLFWRTRFFVHELSFHCMGLLFWASWSSRDNMILSLGVESFNGPSRPMSDQVESSNHSSVVSPKSLQVIRCPSILCKASKSLPASVAFLQ